MCIPIKDEDLEKLKKFIEFVMANPTVLDRPQLEFLIKFLEKFADKILSGRGGGGKYQWETPVAEDQKELNAEILEPNVELDVKENCFESAILQPNIVYLKEEPMTVFKSNRKIKKRSTRLRKTPKKNIKSTTNDPLYTIEDKSKLGRVKIKIEKSQVETADEGNHEAETSDVDNISDYDQSAANEDGDYDFTTGSDYEDEPLIKLHKTKRQQKKLKNKKSCKCKHQCDEKLNDDQKSNIQTHFSSLSEENKTLYLRQHTKQRFAKFILANKPENPKFVFFFEQSTPSIMMHAEDEKPTNSFIKICRSFFEKTLLIHSKQLTEALKDYMPEKEKVHIELQRRCSSITKPIKVESASASSSTSNKKAEKLLCLDAETGDMVPIENCTVKKRRKKDEPPPRRSPKPSNCVEHCRFKCHEQFGEEERRQICDFFWSMDYNRRKDFILSRIETREPMRHIADEIRIKKERRSRQSKFFLRKSGENVRVCRNFIMTTLAISEKVIRNALKYADKCTGLYAGSDGRMDKTQQKAKEQDKQYIIDHIKSFPTYTPQKNSKIRYLHFNLNLTKLHKLYREQSEREHRERILSSVFYSKLFHKEFQLAFLQDPDPLPSKKRRGFLVTNPTVSHLSNYTGLEKGGSWLDPYGNPLDLMQHKPWESFRQMPTNAADINCLPPPPLMVEKKEICTNLYEQQSSSTNCLASPAEAVTTADSSSTLNLQNINLQYIQTSATSNSFTSLFKIF